MTINKTKPSDPSINGDSLSFKNDIEAEFGKNGGRTLGRYRRDDPAFNNTYPNSSTISNLPLDTGIPTSGEIKSEPDTYCFAKDMMSPCLISCMRSIAQLYMYDVM